jgi:iron complex outermembrane recepter protein
VDNQHQSHELRLSSNTDYRFRGLVGLYWEKFNIDDVMNFNYLGVPQCSPANLAKAQAGGPDCLSAIGPLPGTFATDPNLRTDANTAFGEDVQRGYKQRAVFASVDIDIIPKVLTVTGGVRFYHYDEYEHGSEYFSESTSPLVLDHINGACTAAGSCGFPISLDKSESGHRWRGNLTWHPTQDIMAYYTYSEGFRPGGFNRTSSLPGKPPSLAAEIPYYASTNPLASTSKQYEKPAGFQSDNLINHEIGVKSEFFDHRLMLNVSAYYMQWKNVQLPLFDPVYFGNTTFDVNGPNFTIKGFEVQFAARITDGLSVQGSSSVNSSRQSNSPCLQSVGVDPNNAKTANNPTPAGACITQINGTIVPNSLGAYGTAPPFSPPWMFNLRARYDWSLNDFKPFVWVGASHTGPETNEPRNFFDGNNPLYSNPPTTTLLLYSIPGYTTYDAAIGVSKDNWTAQLTGNNLSNAYGPTNVTSGQYIKSEIPLRPRVLMAQLSWKF